MGTLAGRPITLAQIRALPSDPAKLKAAIADWTDAKPDLQHP